MEDPCRIPLQDSHLASRKAEEAALRRFQAVAWLETLVGPLGVSCHPSEAEFLSCLRNGIILCRAINKIQPGSVPKVVENHFPSLSSEFQPLPAYQYFENARNFLVAIKELKLPAFEASDLERDTMEAGSTTKIVDCILAIKCYHEWNQCGGAMGSWKYARSPLVSHSASRMHSCAAGSISAEPCRRLDMSMTSERPAPPMEAKNRKPEDSVDLLTKALADCLFEAKENVNGKLLNSFLHGNQDSFRSMTKILTSFLQEQKLNKCPELKSILKECSVEENGPLSDSLTTSGEKSSTSHNIKIRGIAKEFCCSAHPEQLCSTYNHFKKRCNSCLKKGNCNHWRLLKAQERELKEIKTLMSTAKNDFKALQFQLQSDLMLLKGQVEGLSTSASRYHQVVKENRNLYNMLQDLKGNIRVYCRIRPALNNSTRSTVDFIGDDGSLIIVDPIKLQKDSRKVFQFNKVFGPATSQEDVFKDTRPLIRSVMDGYNVCIFAYGQTGSGKTHTMCGPPSGSSTEMGINFLALNDLFKIASKRKDVMKYEVQVQMVEIYNEQVRDLLSEDTSTTNKLEIRNCMSNGGLALPDANMHLVRSTTDVLNLMKLGETNRAVGSTAVNNRSSRSHSVLTVHVGGEDASGGTIRSCLHLVDLAGSERVDKSEVLGDRLKEAQHINKSLSCLGDVITALAHKSSHVPYRNSKLTQLLQDSLGGHAKTLMFAHVSPEADSYGETISTLKFAQRVSTVELGAARLNKESNNVRELKEQIENLKQEIARKEERNALQSQKTKEPRSPTGKMKVKNDKTPPRPRRLSIENPSVVAHDLAMNPSDNKRGCKTSGKPKKRTEHTPIRLRRLSLEGPKNDNDLLQVHLTSSVNGMQIEASIQCPSQVPDPAEVGSAGATQEASNQYTRSPTTTTSQSRSAKTDIKSRIPKLTKTPERPILMRKEVQVSMESEVGFARKSQQLNSTTMNKKGSQIRKSLQTIGKLIQGQERRIHQLQEMQSPVYNRRNNDVNNRRNNDVKSPLSATNGRNLRRQSLTGVQPPGLDASRRSSLGGKSIDSYSSGTQNVRTPPPVQRSATVVKQWL